MKNERVMTDPVDRSLPVILHPSALTPRGLMTDKT